MLKPELLAPAGDYKSFIAATESGADAVYFGGKDFSARNFAVNLSREEIVKAIDYAHLRGVKCYAAVNILVKDIEFAKPASTSSSLGGLFEYINFLYVEGIDALVIQDLGVFNLCQKYWPDLPLHASTQMMAHNLNDVLVLEKMGFGRVVLARELTLEEVKEIKAKTKIELECFIHGALCFSYSGQCYLSSMIGGRSGNRGRCAQPCRKQYSLVNKETKSPYFPPYQRGIKEDLSSSGYLLSTRDLCGLDILDKLSFVDSLKIEGRMKGAAYVAGATGKYRKYMDAGAEGKTISFGEAEKDKKELAALFNRGGFSHGYWLDKKPADLVTPERSKNFGIRVGEVVEARRGAVKIKAKGVNVNDSLEIRGRGGQEKNFGFRVEKISGDFIDARLKGEEDVRIGDPVYKNFDYELNKKLDLFSRENYQKRIPLWMDFFAREGKALVLKINGMEAIGGKAEKAQKIATSRETIKEQLAKLGATAFIADEIKIDIEGDLNIPLKQINDLRRQAVKKLEEKVINSFKREKKVASLATCRRGRKEKEKAKTDKNGRKIAVQSNSFAVLDALADKKINRIYTSLKINAEKFHGKGVEVYQALPRILRKGEKLKIFEDYDGFLVPSLGYLRILLPDAKKIADFSLNIFNSFSVEELKNLGFSGFTGSIENTLEELNSLQSGSLEKEAVAYGYLPLMIAEHCVLFQTEYCSSRFDNRVEAGRKKTSGIIDEKKITFPIFTDCANCRMQILNSVPLYFTDIDDLEADSIRLIHTIEPPEKFLEIAESYITGDFGSAENTTAGHFYRGVE